MFAGGGDMTRSRCLKNRNQLIAWTVAIQALILGAGWFATFHQVRFTLARQVEDAIRVENGGMADWFSGLMKKPQAVQLARAEVTLTAAAAGALVLGLTTLGLSMLVRRYDDAVGATTRELEEEVRKRLKEAVSTRDALIFGLAKLADYRDTDTGKHLDRICEYSALLARTLQGQGMPITDEWIERLKLAASLHDIGKVGIPDEILLKPGRFTPDERRVMEKHAAIGAETLMAIRARLGDDPFLDMGIEVALQHHEKWDGTGYPGGLVGQGIALSARIVALADFYDALTSRRVYKDAAGHEETRLLIAQSRGTHFDPAVADAFEAHHEQFNAIRLRLQPNEDEQRRYLQRHRRLAA
jgi:response regulator RpfG family c-di-GMP phosphodiesterase